MGLAGLREESGGGGRPNGHEEILSCQCRVRVYVRVLCGGAVERSSAPELPKVVVGDPRKASASICVFLGESRGSQPGWCTSMVVYRQYLANGLTIVD